MPLEQSETVKPTHPRQPRFDCLGHVIFDAETACLETSFGCHGTDIRSHSRPPNSGSASGGRDAAGSGCLHTPIKMWTRMKRRVLGVSVSTCSQKPASAWLSYWLPEPTACRFHHCACCTVVVLVSKSYSTGFWCGYVAQCVLAVRLSRQVQPAHQLQHEILEQQQP